MVDAAVRLQPDAVQLYRGIKIMRPGVSNTTLQCSPSFHGAPRQDAVLLNGDAVATDDDIQTIDMVLSTAFSYSDPSLINLLRWGVPTFGDGAEVDDDDTYVQYSTRVLPDAALSTECGGQCAFTVEVLCCHDSVR